MKKSKIVDIPVKMEKYFGKGTMLHPSSLDIEELVTKIPKGKITTINHLAAYLAKTQGTDVTCPMRTGNAIKKISERFTIESNDPALPFWRVLRSNNTVIKTKNHEHWASKIEDEGFELSYLKSGDIKIIYTNNDLFKFDQ